MVCLLVHYLIIFAILSRCVYVVHPTISTLTVAFVCCTVTKSNIRSSLCCDMVKLKSGHTFYATSVRKDVFFHQFSEAICQKWHFWPVWKKKTGALFLSVATLTESLGYWQSLSVIVEQSSMLLIAKSCFKTWTVMSSLTPSPYGRCGRPQPPESWGAGGEKWVWMESGRLSQSLHLRHTGRKKTSSSLHQQIRRGGTWGETHPRLS